MRSIDVTMPMKSIQSSSVTIKRREVLDHQQVVTWTLKWTRWIQTTEKLIANKILHIPDPVPTKIIIDIN